VPCHGENNAGQRRPAIEEHQAQKERQRQIVEHHAAINGPGKGINHAGQGQQQERQDER